MTTTEIIKLLSKSEHGAITGQSREVYIDADITYLEKLIKAAKKENENTVSVMFGEHHKLVSTGGGDGIGGASLDLMIEAV